MQQLEFPTISEGRLREALYHVLEYGCDGVREITIQSDYQVRIDWLLREFGDCALTDLCGRAGYERIMQAWKREAPRVKNVTIKKRFKFLLRALKLAAARELIDVTRIPPLPKMDNDSAPRATYLTLEDYRKLRSAMHTDRHRAYVDVAFWTGMHRYDIERTEATHIDFDHRFRDTAGRDIGRGGWLMRNHKNDIAHWLPIDDEFGACVREFQQRAGKIDGPIVGRMSKAQQWLHPACDRADVPRVTVAHFRQSRAKYLESLGFDIGMIRYQLGHKGLSTQLTTTHYLGTAPGPGSVALMLDRIGPKAAGQKKMSEFCAERLTG